MASVWGYEIDQLIGMDRSDLGLVILRQFAEGEDFHPHNVTLLAKDQAERAGASFAQRGQFEDSVASACKWLENEGHVVLKAGASSGWQRVSRRGAAAAVGAPAAMRKITLLSGFVLDPRLNDAVANFESGKFDAAMTLATKAIEIAVRSAAGLFAADFGDALMRKAFMTGGLLDDPRIPASENVGRSNLFAGAIGWLRNPAGHRMVNPDTQETAEVVLLANYLIRVADLAAADKTAGWPTP
jgi:hypothetical protein